MRRKSDFVLLIIIGLPCTVLFTILFIGLLSNDYPEKSELQYETCTYVNYEYDKHRYGKGRTSRTYKVYVEEYDTPLIIDNIVFTAVPEARFSTLKKGDKVTLSIESSDDKLYLYTLSADGYNILSYDEYLEKHNSNNKTGIYLLPFMIIMSSGVLFKGIHGLKSNKASNRNSKKRQNKTL